MSKHEKSEDNVQDYAHSLAADKLRAHADDIQTITHFAGPKAVSAVQYVLRALAEMLADGDAVKHTPPPVVKRKTD